MKIVICGSMSAAKAMTDAMHSLVERGHDVITPSNINDHIAESAIEDTAEKIHFDVFRDYYNKIGKSDAILVVNVPKNGIENYIGPNVLIEMAFAYVLDKPIYLLHEQPVSDFSHEIDAMHPIALHGIIDHL